ncbi:MAG: hypothetical protein COA82_06570 [Alkaliphilus sp.]|nr:hypothetical protein [Alkaliphilus sp. AH-315-G20]MBN4067641.1 hypothetical protein [Alkaliphilus transvaalensis]MBN4074829.1 hypothetical protein [bacterium AH-315-E09]PHS34888.1 MAG: hypothetical protein COA82_06570 [Alkaliphilus sp.]
MKTITGVYENISYDITPSVAGMNVTMPAGVAIINGETVSLAETFFDLSIRSEGDYMVMITPNGYFLGLTSDEESATVFQSTSTNYWCLSFALDGTETDLTGTEITTLKAVMA